MKLEIKPLSNRVLIRPVVLPEKESLIIIPDCAKEKSMECEVMAVGPGSILGEKRIKGDPQPSYTQAVRRLVEVKPGDHVLVGKYAGTEFKVDGEELRVVDEADLLAIIVRK